MIRVYSSVSHYYGRLRMSLHPFPDSEGHRGPSVPFRVVYCDDFGQWSTSCRGKDGGDRFSGHGHRWFRNIDGAVQWLLREAN